MSNVHGKKIYVFSLISKPFLLTASKNYYFSLNFLSYQARSKNLSCKLKILNKLESKIIEEKKQRKKQILSKSFISIVKNYFFNKMFITTFVLNDDFISELSI